MSLKLPLPSASALASFDDARNSHAVKAKKRLSVGGKRSQPLTDVTALVLNDDESEKAQLRAEKARAAAEAELAASAPAPSPSPVASKRKSLLPAGSSSLLPFPSLALMAPQRKPLKPMDPSEWAATMKLASAGKFSGGGEKVRALVWGSDLISQMRDLLLGPGSKSALGGASSAAFMFDADADPASSSSSSQFQRASCTLDASMMIYSSRVDDVHKSTFRVLGGLSNQAVSACVGDSDDEGEGAEGEAGEGQLGEDGLPIPSSKKGKKARKLVGSGGAATLEPVPGKLDTKLLETEVAPDPLFRLISAKFEGGARGMLLNNLSVSASGSAGGGVKYGLDSSDEFILDSVASHPRGAVLGPAAEASLRADLDLSALESLFVQTMKSAGVADFDECRLTHGVDELIATRAELMGKPNPVKEQRGRKQMEDVHEYGGGDDDGGFDFAAVAVAEPVAIPHPRLSIRGGSARPSLSPSSDAAAPAGYDADDYDGTGDGFGASADAHDNDNDDGYENEPLPVLAAQMEEVLQAERQERAVGIELREQDDEDDQAEVDDGDSASVGTEATGATATSMVHSNEAALGLLDALGSSARNWAGVKHWKFQSKTASVPAASKDKKTRKKRGTAHLLDFSSVPFPSSASAIVVPLPSSPALLRLPESALATSSARRAREMSLKLPEDRNYRARDLQSLCHKPGAMVKFVRQVAVAPRIKAAKAKASLIPSMIGGAGDNVVDAMDMQQDVDARHAGGEDDQPLVAPVSFSLEQDDDDEAPYIPELPDVLPAEVAPSAVDPASLLLPAPLRAERIEIGYARVSKKVDVKALKETMLKAVNSCGQQAAAAAAPAPPATFASAIARVQSLAQGELATQLPVITPSYYFISLLHLCNEHGWALEDSKERQGTFGDFRVLQQ